MNTAVVHQVRLDHVVAICFEDLRNRVAEQIVTNMTQVEGFVGVGRRVFDHHRTTRCIGLTELLIGAHFGKTLCPEIGRKRDVQEALNDVECAHFGVVSHDVFAYFGSGCFGRFAATSQQGEDNEGKVALELFTCLLNLEHFALLLSVECADASTHYARNKLFDNHLVIMVFNCFRATNLRKIREQR